MFVSVCLFPNVSVSFARMLLTFYRRAPGPIGMFPKKNPGVSILRKN